MKNIYLFIVPLLFSACQNSTLVDNFIEIEGKTQGTTFLVKYLEKNAVTFEKEIDSVLQVIDHSFSTYQDSSLITRFNKSDTGSRIDRHLLVICQKSFEIYKSSDGAFDPTVKPLVDFWGFGPEKIDSRENIDARQIDSILSFVGFSKLKLYEKNRDTLFELTGEKKEFPEGDYFLLKQNPEIQIDFNAIAQGYTVDVVSEFLESKGVENYMVEIGGEIRVKGKNHKGEFWKIGIDKPIEKSESERPLQASVVLQEKALATSGNYRKFFVKDGVKYSHTIDTKSGFPVQQKPTMLSVSVLADECSTADGYATAFMAMGLEKTKKFAEANQHLQAYIVYEENGEWSTFSTIRMKEILEENKKKTTDFIYGIFAFFLYFC